MKTKLIGLFTLSMLITGAIDSIRNLPTTALFGPTLIFFFIAAAVLFLIPAALVSAELSATYPEESGIYQWTKHAFGKRLAFLAVWVQWINTMVWYPTILSFIAGTAVYFISPTLAQNKAYIIAIILVVFWGLTLINLKGVKISARFASICAVVGMIIPMALVILLGLFWVFLGKPIQMHLTWQNALPHFHHSQSWIALTAMMSAFVGMELATVHVQHVKSPQRNFPRALCISVGIILFTMVFGSLAIAFVLPMKQISLVDGIMQAFTHFFDAYHLSWMIPVITIMIVLGGLGGMINWMISPAKGLLQAAKSGLLPKYFTHENKHQVPHRLLITQAIIVSIACSAFLLMPSINGSYWLLTDLSTQAYMFMYIIMFAAAIVLRYKHTTHHRPFKMPGKQGIWLVSGLGLIGCLLTIIIGFIPPSNIAVGGATHYEFVFTIGLLIMLLPGLWGYVKTRG